MSKGVVAISFDLGSEDQGPLTLVFRDGTQVPLQVTRVNWPAIAEEAEERLGDDANAEQRAALAAMRARANELDGDRVWCKFCGHQVSAVTAHLHQGEWVGDECCWDERLKMTE